MFVWVEPLLVLLSEERSGRIAGGPLPSRTILHYTLPVGTQGETSTFLSSSLRSSVRSYFTSLSTRVSLTSSLDGLCRFFVSSKFAREMLRNKSAKEKSIVM